MSSKNIDMKKFNSSRLKRNDDPAFKKFGGPYNCGY